MVKLEDIAHLPLKNYDFTKVANNYPEAFEVAEVSLKYFDEDRMLCVSSTKELRYVAGRAMCSGFSKDCHFVLLAPEKKKAFLKENAEEFRCEAVDIDMLSFYNTLTKLK